ncbi:MAG TPA: cation transporter [Alphaproteobacteria bacterium]|nr:cation transporter [Alphaproteobacteria bacterium]
MANHCCGGACPPTRPDASYRRVLWVALGVNAAMFLVEIGAGLAAGSVSLQADALDFMGDAANYGISLAVLGLSLAARARAALVKGASMGAFGLWVAGATLWNALHPAVPGAGVMGAVGTAALLANIGTAALLYAFRDGDANRRSVWICSRNDAIGNLAVLFAASGVCATGTGWPDVAVAAIMATLALWGAAQVIGQARSELRHDRAEPAAGRA